MGKKLAYRNPRTEAVWNDLEAYRDFCRNYGYVFKEEDLYNMRTYPFQQYNKLRNGKNFKDQWGVDIERMRGNASNQNNKGKRRY